MQSLPYLEAEVGPTTQLRNPSFRIGSGVLLRGVAENPTFPILSALAYTTGLGYRPTCDRIKNYTHAAHANIQFCLIGLLTNVEVWKASEVKIHY